MNESDDGTYVTKANGEDLAEVYSEGFDSCERLPNAQLMAAAPDLLAALKAFQAKWAVVLPAIDGAFMWQHIHGGHYNGPTLTDELAQIDAAIAKAEGR